MISRILLIFMLFAFGAASYFAYAANERAERYLDANRALVAGYAVADADVAIAVNSQTGDVLVRINGIHYKHFEKVCLSPAI